VHSSFAKRSEPGQNGSSFLERALRKPVGGAREKRGRNAITSFLIVDAQSVKNTDSGEQTRYDAVTKVSGIKQHIAFDTQELPHATAVTTAEITDRSGALQAIDRCRPKLDRLKAFLADIHMESRLASLHIASPMRRPCVAFQRLPVSVSEL
jgi:hypothetical protein